MSQREPGALDVCTVQPTALLDCVVRVASLPAACGCRDTPGGSQRVSRAALAGLLSSYTAQQRAGGSAANVARALAAGFNVSCGVVGAVGSDAAGAAVTACLQNSRVDTSRLITQQGAATGACCVLVEPSGQRTMRTCLDGAATLTFEQLYELHMQNKFHDVAWISFTAYAWYTTGLPGGIARAAEANSCELALHLASHELVASFRGHILALLDTGFVSCVFANEDEAAVLAGRGVGEAGGADAGLQLLASKCKTAVVTLGPAGCVAARGAEIVRVPAVASGGPGLDSTGAGDAFAAGFLAGDLARRSLRECCVLGCVAGAAVVECTGAECSPERWAWARAQLPPLGLVDEEEVGASQVASCPWTGGDA